MGGRSGTPRAAVPAVLGPAFIAAIAYVDPGNIVANTQASAEDGYRLLWVVVSASVMAAFVQFQSAKLGIASGHGLAELCGQRFGRTGRWVMWLQCELVAAATDVAEFIGAAIGINLLTGIPLLPAGVITAVVSCSLLAMDRRAASWFEKTTAGLLAVIVLCYLYETMRVHPSGARAAAGLAPSLGGPGTILLAAGIVGATIMPHAIYLHSHLAARQARSFAPQQRSELILHSRREVAVALGVAASVNVGMLVVGAAVFAHASGGSSLTLSAAHRALAIRAGGGAALVFALALLTSGLSSSGVGTLAGQVVMGSLSCLHIRVAVRRIVTFVPALVILSSGVNLADALIASQVLLAFGIPAAMIPLLRYTSDRTLMGSHANRLTTTCLGVLLTAAVVGLNLMVFVQELAHL